MAKKIWYNIRMLSSRVFLFTGINQPTRNARVLSKHLAVIWRAGLFEVMR